MWPISPELTETPELWRKAMRLFPFWGPSREIYDLVTRQTFQPQFAGDGTFTYEPTLFGPAISIDGSSNGDGVRFDIGSVFSSPGGYTLWGVALVDQSPANYGDQTFWGDANSTSLFTYFNDGGSLRIYISGSSTSGPSWVLGTIYNFMVTTPDSQTFTFWVDGVDQGTVSNSSTPGDRGSFEFQLFAEESSLHFLGKALIAGLFDGELNAVERGTLFNDPFAMLRPRSDV